MRFFYFFPIGPKNARAEAREGFEVYIGMEDSIL
jgi:hypothetical protein